MEILLEPTSNKLMVNPHGVEGTCKDGDGVFFDLELVPTWLINPNLELQEIINLSSSLEHLCDSLPSCDHVSFGPTCSYFSSS
ncbi:hypothetical protein Tco_1173506 [Tanacetum coccineum]